MYPVETFPRNVSLVRALGITQPVAIPEFIYIIRPKRSGFLDEPTPEENAVMETHFEYLKSSHQAGNVILVGRCLDRSFGVIIFQAETEQAAHEFMSNDPAVRERVVTAELSPFRVALVK